MYTCRSSCIHSFKHMDTMPFPLMQATQAGGVSEAVDLLQQEQLKKALAVVSELQSAVAELNQTVSCLQRENETVKLQVGSMRAPALSASVPRRGSYSGAAEHDPGALPGGWAPVPGSQSIKEKANVKRSESSNSRNENTATAATVSRLEGMVMDLQQRLKSAECTISCLKDTVETQRAAQEFAKQIRKLEEVGIPTHFTPCGVHRGQSGASSSASMSFAGGLFGHEADTMCYP